MQMNRKDYIDYNRELNNKNIFLKNRIGSNEASKVITYWKTKNDSEYCTSNELGSLHLTY